MYRLRPLLTHFRNSKNSTLSVCWMPSTMVRRYIYVEGKHALMPIIIITITTIHTVTRNKRAGRNLCRCALCMTEWVSDISLWRHPMDGVCLVGYSYSWLHLHLQPVKAPFTLFGNSMRIYPSYKIIWPAFSSRKIYANRLDCGIAWTKSQIVIEIANPALKSRSRGLLLRRWFKTLRREKSWKQSNF